VVGERQVASMGRGLRMLEVMTAVVKNVAVAMRECGERRERPENMWPEVQPAQF
jgi:hypothetical protein